MKHIYRPLTAEEAAHYRKIREQIAEELPELLERHRQRQDGVRALTPKDLPRADLEIGGPNDIAYGM